MSMILVVIMERSLRSLCNVAPGRHTSVWNFWFT